MKLLRSLPIVCAVLLWTSFALAGRLIVKDEARLFSSSDMSALGETAKKWSFEAHVLVAVSPTKAALENRAKAWVDGPNVVVIALDPEHRTTVVRFGNGSNVKSGDFDAISSSGNSSFRSKDFRGGIEAIGNRADMSARQVVAQPPAPPPAIIVQPAPQPIIVQTTQPVSSTVVHEGFGFWGWSLIVICALAFVWFIVHLYRKSKRDSERFQSALNDNREETASLASRNIAEDNWEATLRTSSARTKAPSSGSSAPTPSRSSASRASTRTPVRSAYIPPPPPPVPVAAASSTVVVSGNNSGNDLLTGMLIGDMLSDRHHHHHEVVREREIIRERPTSYDSGGSSSSYGGSSSPSYDSGGSSSSFDSSSSESSSGSSSSWGSSSSSDSGGSVSSYDSGSSSTSYDSGGSSSSFDSSSSSDSGGSSSWD